jgi:tRNA nucleotidyltransferase (CCA-adding enzyme)
MSNICNREGIHGEDRVVLMMAALCHDLGKPDTMEVTDRIRTPKHAEVGVPIAERFLKSIGCFPRIIERVLPLIKEHLAHMNAQTARSVRRLSLRLYPATMRELALLVEADCSGRPPIPKGLPPDMQKLLDLATTVAVVEDKPQPILLGRHLIPLGVQPGKQMGLILKAAFEAQLDGAFATVEEGVEWYQKSRETV